LWIRAHGADAGEENLFDADAFYEAKDVKDCKLRSSWSYLDSSLKTEARPFNKAAQTTLDVVFEDICECRTTVSKSAARKSGAV